MFSTLSSRLTDRRIRFLLGTAIILIGVARIMLTYPDISQTIDESSHIVSGMEWWAQGQYTRSQENPPLARIMIAMGPYLNGAVAVNTPTKRVQVLSGEYPRTLYLARAGTLVFFVMASLMVWGLGTKLHDATVGLLSLTIFTCMPVILAHSGLATTDMSVTAGYCATILGFIYWAEDPSLRRSMLLGLAVGFVILTKYTSILFLSASAAAFLATVLLFSRGRFPIIATLRRFWRPAAVALAIAFLVVWGGFRFSLGPVREASQRPYPPVDRVLGQSGVLHDLAYRLIEAPMVPAPEMLSGLRFMYVHSKDPQTTYLLGETRKQGGFAAYFPVAFMVKTPIPIIVIVTIGAFAACVIARRDRRWIVMIPILGAVAVTVSSMPSGVSVGLRHILPIYSMLSVVAAVGLWWIVGSHYWASRNARIATLGLVAWFLLNSFMSHPDYLSFFNAFAGPSPERILADSDLDWGQSVGRLAQELRQRDIQQVHLGLFTHSQDRFEWPSGATELEPGVETTGWIAASVFHIKVSRDFAWLEAYKPVATVGKSIHLYYIPENGKEKSRLPVEQSR